MLFKCQIVFTLGQGDLRHQIAPFDSGVGQGADWQWCSHMTLPASVVFHSMLPRVVPFNPTTTRMQRTIAPRLTFINWDR